MQRSTPLAITFALDAASSLAFGVASWAFPFATYGTIVAIRGLPADAFPLSALASLSVLYAVVGAVCLCATVMPAPHPARLAVVMAARHAWAGLKGFSEVGRDWLVGNPWHDLIIHSVFVTAYCAFVVLASTRARR
jgi:hypothetical protein